MKFSRAFNFREFRELVKFAKLNTRENLTLAHHQNSICIEYQHSYCFENKTRSVNSVVITAKTFV